MDIGKKIKKLKEEGKPQDQAVAIALNMSASRKKLEKSKNIAPMGVR